MGMKDMLIDLRGTVFPMKCDWCGKEISEETAEPEEAGQWVCYECATSPDPACSTPPTPGDK